MGTERIQSPTGVAEPPLRDRDDATGAEDERSLGKLGMTPEVYRPRDSTQPQAAPDPEPRPYRRRHAWKRCSTNRSATRCAAFTLAAVTTIITHIAAAAATAPVSSMFTAAIEASLVSVE